MKFLEIVPNKMVILKIIPQQSTLNSMNRRLWYSMHELLAVYDSPFKRMSRDGFKIRYQLKDNIWWVVSIKTAPSQDAEGGVITQRQIEFFICLPSTFSDIFTTKLKNHEQWRKCTVKSATEEELGYLPKNSDLYQLKLTRDNMFSLKFDYSQQTSPMRSILQVSQEMGLGDYLGLYTNLEAVTRKKWRGLADYSWEVWERGSVPQRSDIDPERILKSLTRQVYRGLMEIKSLGDDLISVIDRSFFSGRESIRSKQIEVPHPERSELLVNGGLSHQTSNKRNLPAYKVKIMIASSSSTESRRNMLASSLSSAFGELAGDNRFQMTKVKFKFENKTLFPPTSFQDPNILSTDEVGKIVQLPTSDLQLEFKEELESNQNVEIEIPKVFLDPSGIYSGTATNRDKTFDIYIPAKDIDILMTSRAFIGSPRMGKDQMIINLIVESKLKHGIGAVIPDVIDERKGHRGMADAVRDHLPAEDIIDINLGDFDWPVYVGLESITRNVKNERIAHNRIAQELTGFFMGDDLENHQTREYLREAIKATGGSLMGLKLMFMGKSFRAQQVERLRGLGRDVSIWEDFEKMGEGRQGQIYGPVMTRLGEILGDDALRPIFCQRPNPQVKLDKWMEQGKVVIYRVPTRDLSEMSTKILVHWIVMTVFLTKLSMGGEGTCTWLVLNEPHQFLTRGLVHFCQRLLAEGPKLHLAPLFAFHNFKQLVPSDFVEILLSSSLNWHIFKNTNDHVYHRLSNYLSPTFDPSTAMAGTKRFQYIASWLDPKGEYQPPFMVSAPKMIGDRYQSRDNSQLTQEHSRRYGRNIMGVERELQELQRKMFK